MKKFLILLLPSYIFAGNIDVAFSPNQGSLDLVLKAINSAKSNICMASFIFTSKPVANALIAAKKRGVEVKVVADEGASSKRYAATQYLANQGLAIRLNANYKIMHNKFIVVDNQTVETGSFNYTQAAATKNAENVIVLWNHPQVAAKYGDECNRLFAEAQPLAKSY
jgi:phosphatidylserine/phosphatidylglycerophosphate/cardiolipin synthase-like enzyme